MHNRYLCIYLLLFFYSFNTFAQQKSETHINNNLFTAGHAGAFVGGLYNAFYPYAKLKQHGDFGLGAPDKLDGELLLFGGKIYQTESTGKTFEVNAAGSTPFAVVNFFHATKTFKLNSAMSKERLYAYLDSLLTNQNGIYAIHILGTFSSIKTRAFPAVSQKPYLPLAQMLPLQHFFTYTAIKGHLVGYRIPAYMEGANISGYHFHFLSADKQHGGHIVDLTTGDITIEIDYLDGFTVMLPQTQEFAGFDFKKDRREEVKQVENGKKN